MSAILWLGKGRRERNITHYHAASTNGLFICVGDVCYLYNQEKPDLPYIALIEDLFEISSGEAMVRCRWFFRKEDFSEHATAGAAGRPRDLHADVLFFSTMVRGIWGCFQWFCLTHTPWLEILLCLSLGGSPGVV
jgi:hypothetical protein